MDLNAFLEVSLCPACRSSGLSLAPGASALTCNGCHAQFPIKGQVIDFLPNSSRELSRTQKLMENPSVVAIYEDYVRPSFIKLGAPTVTYEKEEKWLNEVLTSSGGIAVDIAAGTGRYSRYLCDHINPDLTLVVDLSLPMLEESAVIAEREGYQNMIHLRADAANLPIANDAASTVLCMAALHLFEDVDGALLEMTRIGKDQATFACLTAQSLTSRLAKPLQRIFDRAATFQFFQRTRFVEQLESLGHSDVQTLTSQIALFLNSTVNKSRLHEPLGK